MQSDGSSVRCHGVLPFVGLRVAAARWGCSPSCPDDAPGRQTSTPAPRIVRAQARTLPRGLVCAKGPQLETCRGADLASPALALDSVRELARGRVHAEPNAQEHRAARRRGQRSDCGSAFEHQRAQAQATCFACSTSAITAGALTDALEARSRDHASWRGPGARQIGSDPHACARAGLESAVVRCTVSFLSRARTIARRLFERADTIRHGSNNDWLVLWLAATLIGCGDDSRDSEPDAGDAQARDARSDDDAGDDEDAARARARAAARSR